MKDKKAQHEMVGFVLIVIIVSIIGIIFLSLMVGRGEPVAKKSIEISDLLKSSLYYTSDCKISFEYKDGQDLIKSCYKKETCSNNEDACEVLDFTFREIIGESLSVGEDSPNKAYLLRIYKTGLDDIQIVPEEEILKIEEGIFSNCSSRVGGDSFIPLVGLEQGVINIELSVCKGK